MLWGDGTDLLGDCDGNARILSDVDHGRVQRAHVKVGDPRGIVGRERAVSHRLHVAEYSTLRDGAHCRNKGVVRVMHQPASGRGLVVRIRRFY